jgi:hypothetical protein
MQKIANKYNHFKKMEREVAESLSGRKQSREIWEEKLRKIKLELEGVEKEYNILKEMLGNIKSIIYDRERRSSELKLQKFKNKYRTRFPEIIKFVNRNYECMVMHHRNNNIPKTNNIAENRNKQIVRRLKTIEAFQHFETAFNYLNLICNYLRFKSFTDCKGKRKCRNGKSPLELCGVKISNRDWLKNSINWISEE